MPAVPVICKQCERKCVCVFFVLFFFLFFISTVNFSIGRAPLLPLYSVYPALYFIVETDFEWKSAVRQFGLRWTGSCVSEEFIFIFPVFKSLPKPPPVTSRCHNPLAIVGGWLTGQSEHGPADRMWLASLPGVRAGWESWSDRLAGCPFP